MANPAIAPVDILADLEAKREYLELLQKRDLLQRTNGIALYKPHKKQDKFHRAGKYYRRMYRAGNRGGKSTCGVVEDISWALGFRPFYDEGDPARYEGIPKKPNKILILGSDWDKIREIFTNTAEGPLQGKIWKFLPTDAFIGVRKNQSGHIEEIRVKSMWGGDSLIVFDTVKSFMSNPQGQESGQVDAIHVDEPCPKLMWVANARGLVDTHGKAWFTLTPIGSEIWIDDMFYPEATARSDRPDGFVHQTTVDGVLLEFWSITGSIYDNPFNTKESIAGFLNDLTEEEKEARIEGRPQLYAGIIFKEFKDDEHIYRDLPKGWKDYNCPPRNYCIRIAIDTHPARPHATLFAATGPSGHTFFWEELFEKGQIHEYAARIWTLLDGRVPHRSWLELQAYTENPVAEGRTIAEEFYDAGFNVEKASRDLQFGIMKTKSELQKRDNFGKPWLLFSPKLRTFHREIQRYVWDDDGKPVDKNDHMMENFRRLVMGGLEYIEPSEVKYVVQPMMNLDSVSTSLPPTPDLRLRDFDEPKKPKRIVPSVAPTAHSQDRWRALDLDWPELNQPKR